MGHKISPSSRCWRTTTDFTQTFYNKAQHAEEFLYNHDWVFHKILSLP
ncbi:MAG: hypothetical protein IJM81_01420 [Prevotella sp.]|nr:hypothetical protein [Prevotella sp.]